jgi:hypothetical protein
MIPALCLCIAGPALAAQNARMITLRIKPHVGDTLYTRFEQTVEMTGTTRVGDTDTTMTRSSSMLMLSHVLVQASDDRGTTVTTVTDSVSLLADGDDAALPPESVRRAMEGRRVQLRIAPDGSATIVDQSDELTPDVRAVVSGMPSTLPDRPVAVGATWEKVMEIPVAGRSGPGHAAVLRATYRLDSLSANGDIACISVRGTLTRDSTAIPLSQGLRISSHGTMTGTLRVDRRHGWWADSHATIALKSIFSPTAGNPAHAMQVQTKITQHMKTWREP